MNPTKASQHFTCSTCGTQYPSHTEVPAVCAICADERQYLPPGGQAWTSAEALARTHRNAFRRLEPGLLGISTEPLFALGQRALLVETPIGNVLWDCIPLLDDATVDIVRALGGLAAIAVSHPHYYSNMVDWAHAFGCPIHVHEDDRRWVVRRTRRYGSGRASGKRFPAGSSWCAAVDTSRARRFSTGPRARAGAGRSSPATHCT